MRVWHVREPGLKIKFRLFALLFPLLSWPLYTLIYHHRTGAAFGHDTALIDFRRWLDLHVVGYTPLWYLFLLVIGVTALLFLIQELAPALRQPFSKLDLTRAEPGRFPKLDVASAEIERLSISKPVVFIADQPVPVIFSAGIGQGSIVLSPSLLETLDEEELVAVIAHEVAHVRRGDHRLTWALFLLRSLMFYNPVALFITRRLLQDNEKVSDDVAVSLTRKPLPLAAGLLKVFGQDGHCAVPSGGGTCSWVAALESQACRSMVTDRVKRLTEYGSKPVVDYGDTKIAVTMVSLAALLFFVV